MRFRLTTLGFIKKYMGKPRNNNKTVGVMWFINSLTIKS